VGTQKNLTDNVPDRFTLEEMIMACWHTADDLELAAAAFLDGTEDIDALHTTLAGIASMHKLRCQKLWDVFETLIHDGDIK